MGSRLMPDRELILSIFPGADLLGRGFEADGFCVVRRPDRIQRRRHRRARNQTKSVTQ